MIDPSLAVEVVALTAGGVVSPGPLSSSAIIGGSIHGWKYGFKAALGHMFFELPLFVLLGVGTYNFLLNPTTRRLLSIAGGFIILFFAVMFLRDLLAGEHAEGKTVKTMGMAVNPILLGLMLTAFNPYFLVWWGTVGVKIIADINLYSPGLSGMLEYYAVHVWMDYAWLSLLAYMASKGLRANKKILELIQLVLITAMIYYALRFLIDAFT
ncbi:MAG: LysE family transporter [Infirmifilum sp.]|uniref:Lysine transporter LysE n=1 Tax=Infirmifilum uzonense TaxID=1550241 RepID=A0A0F7FGA0_9CREN|nr:LysE family transporter [Infirmifilum uzonense]AKG38164.1 hypothetical protein MA03_01115 [Infirmifilum uzonense]